MNKESFHPEQSESIKETLKKWAVRLGLIAIGFLGLRWIL
jgi:hypothetical protein